MRMFKIAMGWVLLVAAIALVTKAFFFHGQFDKPAAAMLLMSCAIAATGGGLVLWSD